MFKSKLRNTVAATIVFTAVGGVAKADENDGWKVFNPPADVIDEVTRIYPRYGNLDAFYGNLDAFWGNLDAFWGNLDPFYGNLDPFYGNLDPFYGNLDPFWGNLDAFYGNLDAFYGNLDAFWGSLDAFYGSLDAFYGSLDAFWGNLDPFYGNLDPFYGNLDPFTELDFAAELGSLFDQAEASFGAAVTSTTGVTFEEAIVAPLLEKYGISSDYSDTDELSRDEYGAFLLELHDTLMGFTGFDHVDHWMGSVNWSPRVAQEANSGAGVRVGVVDTRLQDDSMINNNQKHSFGYSVADQDHGNAIASLIAATHDGKGAMGIAPNVLLNFYNPFDETFTTNWDDVRAGVKKLGQMKVSVINLSLGVSGWTLHEDWAGVLGDSKVARKTGDVVFVKAAGNDGVEQSIDIEWGDLDAHNRLLIVGSVDPSGEISSFSNTPGDACLLNGGKCGADSLLMNRFLVAPGELVLVSDGAGGVTRASGTSFAAPMVTGAVALLQSRWEWLQDHPVESADIILRSATDLGDPGVDGTYGWGLLNIEASQAPLDPDALFVRTQSGDVKLSDGGLTSDALAMLNSAATITAFEEIGETYRDFEVAVEAFGAPLSSPEAEQASSTEEYLSAQLEAAPESEPSKKKNKKEKKDKKKFTNGLTASNVSLGNIESTWLANITATRRDPNEVVAADAVPFQVGAEMHHIDSGVTLQMGQGQGALAFSQGSEFGLLSDHDLNTGGVNPFLGLASGGYYLGAEMPVADGVSVSFGFTQDTDEHHYLDQNSGELISTIAGLEDYKATAVNLKVVYAAVKNVNMHVAYTQLNEATGLLGGQGVGALGLDGGAATDAVTVGADADLGDGFGLSASASAGKTRSTEFQDSIFSVAKGGILSTALQVTASKAAVLNESDLIRLSIAQPLHFENGALGVTAMQVVDRSSGELALVTDNVALYTDDRRYISEMLYATPIMEGRASISAFAQVELNNYDLGFAQTAVAGGGKFSIKF